MEYLLLVVLYIDIAIVIIMINILLVRPVNKYYQGCIIINAPLVILIIAYTYHSFREQHNESIS